MKTLVSYYKRYVHNNVTRVLEFHALRFTPEIKTNITDNKVMFIMISCLIVSHWILIGCQYIIIHQMEQMALKVIPKELFSCFVFVCCHSPNCKLIVKT